MTGPCPEQADQENQGTAPCPPFRHCVPCLRVRGNKTCCNFRAWACVAYVSCGHASSGWIYRGFKSHWPQGCYEVHPTPTVVEKTVNNNTPLLLIPSLGALSLSLSLSLSLLLSRSLALSISLSLSLSSSPPLSSSQKCMRAQGAHDSPRAPACGTSPPPSLGGAADRCRGGPPLAPRKLCLPLLCSPTAISPHVFFGTSFAPFRRCASRVLRARGLRPTLPGARVPRAPLQLHNRAYLCKFRYRPWISASLAIIRLVNAASEEARLHVESVLFMHLQAYLRSIL